MPSTTPVRSRPYPLETDTPDVASDIKALALSLDNAPTVTQGALSARPTSGMIAGDRYMVEGDSTAANNGIEWYYTGSAWIITGQLAVVESGSNVNLSAGEQAILTAGVTGTLPAPSMNATVKVAAFGVTGSSPATVARSSGALIYGRGLNGATSFLLGTPGATVELRSDGTNWYITQGAQDSGWVQITPSGGATTDFYARLTGNRVDLRGSLLGSSVSNEVTATLSSSFVPTATRYFGVYHSAGNGSGDNTNPVGGLVTSAGAFTAYADSTSASYTIGLDGSFYYL